MRTKTLLLTAALSAAGLATSMAQVYSVNAVGYVNISIPAHGYGILGNPLNGTNNSVSTILSLPNGYDGSNIYRFDPPTQSYLDTVSWIEGFGWLSPSDPDPTINPGEGFFFQNGGATTINLTFVGEVPAGTLHNPVAGGNKYSIRSSVVPKGLKLGNVGVAGTLEFPADDGDNVYIFDIPTQSYKDTYSYILGLGWISGSDPDPDGPVIPVATGFFSQKTAPARDWVQSFSVN